MIPTPAHRGPRGAAPSWLALVLLLTGGVCGCFGSSVEEGSTRPLRQFGRNGILTAVGEERFEDGEWRKHGEFIFRDERGEEISRGSYAAGLETGPWTQTYEDGSRGEGAFLEGRRTGEWRTFFPGGAAQDSGRYLDGRRTGEWESRRRDGTLLRRAMYVDGVENGPVTYFQEDGRTVDRQRTGIYRDGELQPSASR